MFNEELPEAGTESQAGTLPIRTVSAMTGVNPVTLRAWERRYGLIRPQRTASGHRLYSRDDVDLIQEVVRQLDAGINVSQVRIQAASEPAARPRAAPTADPWSEPLRRMHVAIGQFDEAAVERVYEEALSLYPMDVVINRLIVPLMRELGQRWEQGTGMVAEEHFFVVYLRNKLGARLHHRGPGSGMRLLAACLPGERHENGLLLFALAAQERDYRIVLLGADMPLEELPRAASRARSEAIVLSGSTPLVGDVIHEALPALVRDARMPVFVGGRISELQRDAVAAAGAIALGEELRPGLKILDTRLRGG
jgi:DNA-binding transcriptional MerR regulator/methylmalonyl-CoA mutase cobalamin-binding subunit